MKKVIAALSTMFLFVVLLATAPASSAADVPATETMAVTMLADLCSKAAKDPSDTAVFTPGMDLKIKPDYVIKVYELKAGTTKPNPAKTIAVSLDKGSDPNVEIPRITTICVNGVPQPVLDKGKIEFTADPAIKKVPISFRLLGSLKYTHWKNEDKPESNDSVWMIENAPGQFAPPNQTNWPKCMKGKHVKFLDPKSIVFSMCENTGTDLIYFYALHMDLRGSDNISVDVGIDPQIIHHP